MPLTTKDVLALRDKVIADAKSRRETLTPLEIVQGTRTLVHAALQEERPMPYDLPAPDKGKSDADFHQAAADVVASRVSAEDKAKALANLHVEHQTYRAERIVKARAMVTSADQVEFQKVRPPFVGDAHHFVQWKHGVKLWEDTDKLVAAAGVK